MPKVAGERITWLEEEIEQTREHQRTLPTHSGPCDLDDPCGACRARAWLLVAERDLQRWRAQE